MDTRQNNSLCELSDKSVKFELIRGADNGSAEEDLSAVQLMIIGKE